MGSVVCVDRKIITTPNAKIDLLLVQDIVEIPMIPNSSQEILQMDLVMNVVNMYFALITLFYHRDTWHHNVLTENNPREPCSRRRKNLL